MNSLEKEKIRCLIQSMKLVEGIRFTRDTSIKVKIKSHHCKGWTLPNVNSTVNYFDDFDLYEDEEMFYVSVDFFCRARAIKLESIEEIWCKGNPIYYNGKKHFEFTNGKGVVATDIKFGISDKISEIIGFDNGENILTEDYEHLCKQNGRRY